MRSSDLTHYSKSVLPADPAERESAKKLFKSYVDSVAVVKVENGEKLVCLRKRFRGSSKQPEERDSNGHHVPPVKLHDHVVHSVPENEELPPAPGYNTEPLCGIASQATINGSPQRPSLVPKSEVCRNEDTKQNKQCGTDSGNEPRPTVLQTGSVPSKSQVCESKDAKQEIPPACDCGTDGTMGVRIPLTNSPATPGESGLASPRVRTEMGTQHSRSESRHDQKSCDAVQSENRQTIETGLPQITMKESTNLEAAAEAALDLPDVSNQTQALSEEDTDQSQESDMKAHEQTETARKSGRTSPFQDEGREESTTSNTPKGSRKSFLQHMMSSSPQVRRSLVLKHPSRFRDPAAKSAGDSTSVNSASTEDESSSVMLEPVEHEWMMCACEGEWESLHRLLATNPNLVTKKDFVTGFTCLHWASKLGKHELLALFINFARQRRIPLDVNVRSSAGYTPLHLAAMHGHVEVIKLLVGACNADVEARDYSGKKASQYLRSDIGQDVLDIAGADTAICDAGYMGLMVEDDSARWKLPKVLQGNLKLLNRSVSEEEARDCLGPSKEKPLRRKSSLNKLKPRLSKRGSTTTIVHSVSHFERLEGAMGQASGSFKSRPKSNLFG